jgi:hypothetical protein
VSACVESDMPPMNNFLRAEEAAESGEEKIKGATL